MEEWLRTPAIVAVAVALLGLLWKAARWTARVDDGIDSLKEALSSFKEEVRADIEEIRSDIEEIRSDMKEIRSDTKRIFERLPNPHLKTSSPVTLTERGEAAAESIKVREWASGLAGGLASRVEGKREFEIHEFCQDYMDEMSSTGKDAEMLDRVRECAYEFGSGYSDVLEILGVVLRDEILKTISD